MGAQIEAGGRQVLERDAHPGARWRALHAGPGMPTNNRPQLAGPAISGVAPWLSPRRMDVFSMYVCTIHTRAAGDASQRNTVHTVIAPVTKGPSCYLGG